MRLPKSFLCYTPPQEAPPVAMPPNELLGCISFGSFNNVAKINARVVHLWVPLPLDCPLGNDSIVHLEMDFPFRDNSKHLCAIHCTGTTLGR